jgi:hypothetical protein
MIDLNGLITKLKSGEIPASSEFDLLNEKRQFLPQGVGIPRFSYGYKKKSRILFRLQMAIPFNPETGLPDEKFNPNKKWRPPLSPRSAAMIVKQYAENSKEAKEIFMNRAGISEWDTSDATTLNKTDFKVLRLYRTPLIITAEAVTINDSAITGQDFGISYSVPVKRDIETGQIIGDIPEIAKIGNLISTITFKEIAELDNAIKSKDPGGYSNHRPFINPAAIPTVDDKTKREWVGKILSGALISSVRPKNFLMAYEFALSPSQSMLNSDKKPLPCFTRLTLEDIKEHRVYFDYAKKYKEYIETQLNNPELDQFWDFVEADICDKALEEPKDRVAKAEASRNMSLSASSHSFYNVDTGEWRADWVQPFFDAISDFGDSDPEFEKKMMQFVARQIRPIDNTIIGSVADRIADKIPLSYRYITEDILRNHKDALLLIYGSEYTDLMLGKGLISEDAIETSESGVIAEKNKSVADLIDSVYEEENNSSEAEKETSKETNDIPLATMEEFEVDKIEV